jgi:GNAT superfamily N-acetyltransferase
MKFILTRCQTEGDFWRIRNFLREVFLLNGRIEDSWHVARLDYWRWHFIDTCEMFKSFQDVMVTWQTGDGNLAAVLHPICHDEVRLHIHPAYRTPELEDEAFAYAEEHFSDYIQDGRKCLYMPIFQGDDFRTNVLEKRGFTHQPGWGHHYFQDLDGDLPQRYSPPGFEVRSMGGSNEYHARCWASWRAFHPDEPDSDYSGHEWYVNMQSAPLYRRDLDIVAATPTGEIGAFCTIFYDDYTRSAVTVVVGTAAEYWKRGLGKAAMIEGFHRLKQLGCTRVFSTAHEEPADALYGSVMHNMRITDTWTKVF